MAEEQPNINDNTPPPGSSESFNQFKDRILSAMGDIADSNEGHNTVVVTHSKPIKTINGWEHAGYPEDDSLHQATYDKDPSAGSHTELDANTAAALRIRNAVIPPGGRKEGAITQWIESQGNKIKSDIEDIFKHPENIVGTGMMKGPGGPKDVIPFRRAANDNKPSGIIGESEPDVSQGPFEFKITPRKRTAENTFVGEDRNKYPRTYMVKDSDVAQKYSQAMEDLVTDRRKWILEGNHPDLFDVEFKHIIERRDELGARLDDIIKNRSEALEPKGSTMDNPTQPQQSQHFGVTPKSSEWTQDEFGNLVRTLASEPIDYKAPVGDRAKVKSEELLNRIQKLFDQGLKHSEVADNLGINRKTLSSIQSRNATRDRPLGKKPRE